MRALVQQFLAERAAARVGQREWDELLALLARQAGDVRRVSPRVVLDLLHQTGVEVDRVLGGLPKDLRGRVPAAPPQAVADALLEMSAEYAKARSARDEVRAEDVRRAVRQAKDRLRLTLRRRNLRDDTRAVKQETLEWFLVWLENPGVFPAWLEARLSRGGRGH